MSPSPAPRLDVTRRFRVLLLVVVGVAFAVRLSSILWDKGDDCPTTGFDHLCGDAIWYSNEANLLADGHFFRSPKPQMVDGVFTGFGPGAAAADHPPLAPLVLAPVSALSGDSVTAHRVTITLVGCGAVALIGLLGRRVASARAGLIAAGLAAVYPNLWLNDTLVMSEAFAAAGTAACLLAIERLRACPDRRNAAITGVLLGFTMLARAELGLLLVVTIAPLLALTRTLTRRARLGRFALVAATAAAVLAPWTIVNLTRFDRPVLISTNDGLTLLGANCDKVYSGGAIGIWAMPAAEPLGDPTCAPDVPRPDGDQSVVAASYRRAAASYVRHHLDEVPAVVAARLGRVWSVYETHQMWWYNEGEGRERRWSRWGEWMYKALLPFAAAGALLLRKRRVDVWPLLSTAVIVSITAVAFYGLVRFRVPFEVALVVLAGAGLSELVERRWPERAHAR